MKIKKNLALTTGMLASCYLSYAQASKSLFNEGESMIADLGPTFFNIAIGITIFGAVVWLVIILINNQKNGNQQKDGLITWFLTVGAILLFMEMLRMFL